MCEAQSQSPCQVTQGDRERGNMLTLPAHLVSKTATGYHPRPAVKHWQTILRECKYPTEVVVLDFETYADTTYNLTKLSTVEYIADKRFEILGLATLPISQPYDDYEQRVMWWERDAGVKYILDQLRGEYGENLERCTVVMKNANFDASILGMKYDIFPPHVIDIDGLARHWNSRARNTLEALATRYKLPPKGDTKEFMGCSFRSRIKPGKRGGPPVIVPPMDEAKALALASYAKNDDLREWELFTILLPKLSNPAFELRVMQHTLELFTRPVLQIDTAKAEELKGRMVAAVEEACANVGRTQDEIGGNKTFIRLMSAALAEAGDEPERYMKPVKGGGVKLAEAKVDPERELLLKHPDSNVKALMEARNAVKSWPLHIARIDRMVNQAAARGGVLPLALKYHGAHTGRWAGGEKINPQNLGSRGHELVNAVRELIIAPPGHELVIVDCSQIEARVLSWLAGQDDLTEKFRVNAEIYCEFATNVLGWKVRKPRSGGIPSVEARHKWARNTVGKVGVLGCGYGMGKDRMVEQNPGLDLDLADRIVQTYRGDMKAIVKFWYDIESAFVYTADTGRTNTLPRGLRFDQTEDCDVIITLPSGRELKYHHVQLEMGMRGKKTIEVWNDMEKHWEHVWGGHLTENVVQAISRDILIEAIMDLEAERIHTAHHVHDEGIMVVPEGQGERVLARAIERYSQTPTWGPGLPLAAEGVVTQRYGGH